MNKISELTADISRTFYDLQAENKELRETIEKLSKKDDLRPMACKCCRHFKRHYVYDDAWGGFAPIHSGHCMRGRRIERKPSDKTCEYFELMKEEK